jgi:hypothetical protein
MFDYLSTNKIKSFAARVLHATNILLIIGPGREQPGCQQDPQAAVQALTSKLLTFRQTFAKNVNLKC